LLQLFSQASVDEFSHNNDASDAGWNIFAPHQAPPSSTQQKKVRWRDDGDGDGDGSRAGTLTSYDNGNGSPKTGKSVEKIRRTESKDVVKTGTTVRDKGRGYSTSKIDKASRKKPNADAAPKSSRVARPAGEGGGASKTSSKSASSKRMKEKPAPPPRDILLNNDDNSEDGLSSLQFSPAFPEIKKHKKYENDSTSRGDGDRRKTGNSIAKDAVPKSRSYMDTLNKISSRFSSKDRPEKSKKRSHSASQNRLVKKKKKDGGDVESTKSMETSAEAAPPSKKPRKGASSSAVSSKPKKSSTTTSKKKTKMPSGLSTEERGTKIRRRRKPTKAASSGHHSNTTNVQSFGDDVGFSFALSSSFPHLD